MKKEYKFDGENLPTAFNTEVIMRMFKDSKEGMRAFFDGYKNARLVSRKAYREPTKEDYAIAEMFKSVRNYAEVGKRFSMKHHQVMDSVGRVARYKFLNS